MTLVDVKIIKKELGVNEIHQNVHNLGEVPFLGVLFEFKFSAIAVAMGSFAEFLLVSRISLKLAAKMFNKLVSCIIPQFRVKIMVDEILDESSIALPLEGLQLLNAPILNHGSFLFCAVLLQIAGQRFDNALASFLSIASIS